MSKSPNAKSLNERFLELTIKNSPYEVVFFDSNENCFLPKGFFFDDDTKLNFSLFCKKYISNLDVNKLKNAYHRAESNKNFAIDINLKKYGTYSVCVKSVISRGSFQGVFFYFSSSLNLLSIFDELPFLCIAVDSNGLIRNASKKLLSVLNVSDKSLISKHINDVVQCDSGYSYVNSNAFSSDTTSRSSLTSSRNTKNDFESIYEALNQQKISINKKNGMKFYANTSVFEYSGYTVVALEKFTDNAVNAKNFFGNIRSIGNIGSVESVDNDRNARSADAFANQNDVQNDILYQSPIPCVVLDGFGKIEWFNDEFVKNIAPYGERILGKMIGSWMKCSEMENISTNISSIIKENSRVKGMSFKLYSDMSNFANEANGFGRFGYLGGSNASNRSSSSGSGGLGVYGSPMGYGPSIYGYGASSNSSTNEFSGDKSNLKNRVFQFLFHGMVNLITTNDNVYFDGFKNGLNRNYQASPNDTTKSFRKSYFLFVVNDISQEEEKEKKIINAQKLQVIGQMALNISHDFRNILTSIGIACELLKDDMDNDMKTLSASNADSDNISNTNYDVSSANQKLRKNSYERRQNDLISIRDSASKAEKLVEQILSFSKQSDSITEKFSINQYLNESKMMLNRLVGPKIQLEIVAHDGNDFIVFNKSQFDQIVVNLIVNARDAINNIGKIRVSVNEVVVTRGNNQIYKLYGRVCGNLGDIEIPLGKYRVISITDNGCGIDKYVLSQMFKPFFSTKGNQGNGLGLATIAGILKSNGGYIAVHTEVNKGSKFSVFFRENNSVTQNGASGYSDNSGVSSSARYSSYSSNKKSVHSILSLGEKINLRGNTHQNIKENIEQKTHEKVRKKIKEEMREKAQESSLQNTQKKVQGNMGEKIQENELRILVVDDNDSVRSFVSRVVETITPHVLNVNNGIEALNLAKEQKLDILLTDVEMNEMDGPELVKKMLKIQPNIEVIFLSGYSKDDLKYAFDSNLQSGCDYIFLSKPFGLKEIVSTIKNVAAKMNNKI